MPAPLTYRAFRRRPDGAWLSALLTTAKPRFSAKPEQHAEQVAGDYGLTVADVDVVDGPADPRVAPLVTPRLPAGATEPLVDTLVADVEAVAQGQGVRLPQPFHTALARRIRERLQGVP